MSFRVFAPHAFGKPARACRERIPMAKKRKERAERRDGGPYPKPSTCPVCGMPVERGNSVEHASCVLYLASEGRERRAAS